MRLRVLALPLVSLLVACDPGGTIPLPGEDSGSDAPVAVVDSGHDASDGGVAACGFEFAAVCGACVATSCCSAWQACSASAPCVVLDHCLIACHNDTACLQLCSNATTMAVVDVYNKGADCLTTRCDTPCYGATDGGSHPRDGA